MRAKKPKSRNSFTEGYKTYDAEREGFGDERQWQRAFYERMNNEEAREILDAEEDKDPYKVLGLSEGVTFDVIKKRFRTLAMQFHRDKLTAQGASEEEIAAAEEKLKRYVAAYTILDNELRKTRQ